MWNYEGESRGVTPTCVRDVDLLYRDLVLLIQQLAGVFGAEEGLAGHTEEGGTVHLGSDTVQHRAGPVDPADAVGQTRSQLSRSPQRTFQSDPGLLLWIRMLRD